jgi:hypothetical protein
VRHTQSYCGCLQPSSSSPTLPSCFLPFEGPLLAHFPSTQCPRSLQIIRTPCFLAADHHLPHEPPRYHTFSSSSHAARFPPLCFRPYFRCTAPFMLSAYFSLASRSSSALTCSERKRPRRTGGMGCRYRKTEAFEPRE